MMLKDPYQKSFSTAILHGSGYVGRELTRLVSDHPLLQLDTVASGSATGKMVYDVHPSLRGIVDLEFTDIAAAQIADHDVVFVAGVPGTGVAAYKRLSENGFTGVFVDLSTDFRFADPTEHLKWNGAARADDSDASDFTYGLPEVCGPYPAGARRIANPGCFATGLALAIWPLASNLSTGSVQVTALTGASGSGVSPSKTTHFPDRDGNVRAYNVFAHRHVGEVLQVVGQDLHIGFVPVSGPWTRGIWGTAQITLPFDLEQGEIDRWFDSAYVDKTFVRLWHGPLPELRYAVGTPFCDIGWKVSGRDLVVVFALDNLLKGAASQAIQNANLTLGLPESLGLLSTASGELEIGADIPWS